MSKEIIDKINNNLIMLVEGFDDAERDYGYDLANEKHYVSELIDLVENLSLSGVSQRSKLFVLFAEWLQNNGKWMLPKEQVKEFFKEQKETK